MALVVSGRTNQFTELLKKIRMCPDPAIDVLTDDELVLIFTYLDYEALESLYFTCQRFSEVVEEYFFSR